MQGKRHRDAIRKSWGNVLALSALPVDLRFYLAQPNTSELAAAHDLLQVTQFGLLLPTRPATANTPDAATSRVLSLSRVRYSTKT